MPNHRLTGQIAAKILLFIVAASAGLPTSAQEQPGVTVEAQRKHAQLEHDVQAFTHQAIIRPPAVYNQSLERWNEKVCPQVQGLDRPEGEFILSRLSGIARAAGVPLAGENCSANFVVFVTAQPEALIRKLLKEPKVFDRNEDKVELADFVSNPRPIRVWRSLWLTTIDGSQRIKAHGEKQYADEPHSTQLPSFYGSRLNAAQVTRDFSSVIVVVDAAKVMDLNMGQLGDYIGMIGFAQVDMDHQISDVPTILNVFRLPHDDRPLEMTKWDKALLRSLYASSQRDTTQFSQIQDLAVREIEAE
jgi:hypothetical protein